MKLTNIILVFAMLLSCPTEGRCEILVKISGGAPEAHKLKNGTFAIGFRGATDQDIDSMKAYNHACAALLTKKNKMKTFKVISTTSKIVVE